MSRENLSTSTAADDASAEAPHLSCYFKSQTENKNGDEKFTTVGKILLFQEKGKKSSFLLQEKQENSMKNPDMNDDTDWYSISKPAHLVVGYDKDPNVNAESNGDNNFLFGGLQLVFSEKSAEIFLTSPEGDETYLMTCKGIPYQINEKKHVSKESTSTKLEEVEWRRALCVVPGGPRCISRLRIKLAGNASETESALTKVQYMKLTARLVNPTPEPVKTSTLKSTNVNSISQKKLKNVPSLNPNMFFPAMASTNVMPVSEPPLTQKDLGAAMAGLSFMAKKTEENMIQLFKEQSKQFDKNLQSHFSRMDLQMRAMQPALAVQNQLIQENQILMNEQQQILEYQTQQINRLLIANQDLEVRVQSLQADLSIMRSQASYGNLSEIKADARTDTSESKLSPEVTPRKEPPVVDSDSHSSAPVAEEDQMKMENAYLRNIIKNTAQGIGTEPLLQGCGSDRPESEVKVNYFPDSALGSEMENAHLRNIIKNTARNMDEEPLLRGCGGTTMTYTGFDEDSGKDRKKKSRIHREPGGEMVVSQYKNASSANKEIEGQMPNGACGSMFHGIEIGIMEKIESIISSSIKPSAIPLETTRAIQNTPKHSGERHSHASNIEITLMQDQKIEADDEESVGRFSVD